MAPGGDASAPTARGTRSPSVAIVGYTNAGKSSLLNRLTGRGRAGREPLFATLDPTVRAETDERPRVHAHGHRRASCGTSRTSSSRHSARHSRRRPVQIWSLHVVDASHPDPGGQISAVRKVLGGARRIRRARDRGPQQGGHRRTGDHRAPAQPGRGQRRRLRTHRDAGFEELRELIAERLPRPAVEVDLVVPYSPRRPHLPCPHHGGRARRRAPDGGHSAPRPRG